MTGQPGPRADITVIGEAIIDLVPGAQPQTYHAAPGGSPYNVADAFTSGGSLHRPARDITVAGTVGAGDSFTAGLIGSLIR